MFIHTHSSESLTCLPTVKSHENDLTSDKDTPETNKELSNKILNFIRQLSQSVKDYSQPLFYNKVVDCNL